MPSERTSPISAFFGSFFARWFWGALLLGTVLSLMLFGRDLEIMLRWESAAREHAWLQWWATIASRSLFSAGKLGAQDVSHALLLLVLAAWAVSLRKSVAVRLPHFRAWTWYYLTCLLFFFLVNRGVKVFFGRVRPLQVLRGDLDYTPMWCIGQYELLDALSKGSFTSGHTTMAMVLLPMAFLTIGTPRFAVSFSMFVLALGWALLVGWGRVINGSHYRAISSGRSLSASGSAPMCANIWCRRISIRRTSKRACDI